MHAQVAWLTFLGLPQISLVPFIIAAGVSGGAVLLISTLVTFSLAGNNKNESKQRLLLTVVAASILLYEVIALAIGGHSAAFGALTGSVVVGLYVLACAFQRRSWFLWGLAIVTVIAVNMWLW